MVNVLLTPRSKSPFVFYPFAYHGGYARAFNSDRLRAARYSALRAGVARERSDMRR
jgi:hypothetical protein